MSKHLPKSFVVVGAQRMQLAAQREKKLISDVWQNMDREVLGGGNIRATCHHCHKVFTANSTNGTSHQKAY